MYHYLPTENVFEHQWWNLPYLTAGPCPITDRTDVDHPCTIRGRGQHVCAAALEVKVLPVKSAVVGSTPGHAGGRTLGHPGATQQTATHQWGGLGVCRQGREEGGHVFAKYKCFWKRYIEICGVNVSLTRK